MQEILFYTDDIAEQKQNDGTHGIAEDSECSPGHDTGPFLIQDVTQKVLDDQAEKQDDDDQHDPSVLPVDIGVDQDREQEPEQNEKDRNIYETLYLQYLIHDGILPSPLTVVPGTALPARSPYACLTLMIARPLLLISCRLQALGIHIYMSSNAFSVINTFLSLTLMRESTAFVIVFFA